jgi:hypothetical protein
MAEPVPVNPASAEHPVSALPGAVRAAADLRALADRLPSMDAPLRQWFAREIQRQVSSRVYAELCIRAGQMRAEFRFMDLMDQHIARLAAGLILLAAGWLFAAEMAMRGFTAIGAPALAMGTANLAWAGLFLVLPLWLAFEVRRLRRRAMGGGHAERQGRPGRLARGPLG